MEEMKACPFCGETIVMLSYYQADETEREVRIVCSNCDAKGPPGYHDNDATDEQIAFAEDAAIERWNGRHEA